MKVKVKCEAAINHSTYDDVTLPKLYGSSFDDKAVRLQDFCFLHDPSGIHAQGAERGEPILGI